MTGQAALQQLSFEGAEQALQQQIWAYPAVP